MSELQKEVIGGFAENHRTGGFHMNHERLCTNNK